MCVSWKTMTWSLLRSVGQWVKEWRSHWTTESMNAATNESMNEEIGATSSSKFFAVSLRDRALATISCVCCQFHCPPGSDPLIFCNFSMQSKCFEMHPSLSLQSGAHFADLIFQKCFDPLSFLRFLCEIELSLQSRVHFSGLIFQKYSEHFSFYRFLCANRALVTVLYTFCRPHLPKVLRVATELSLQSCALLFQKCSAPVSLWTFWSGNRALATVLCIFVGNFPRSTPPTQETATLLRRSRKPLYPTKTCFAPESVSTRECTRSRTVTLPNSLMMGGWYDETWTWWKTAPGHSPATRKFSN